MDEATEGVTRRLSAILVAGYSRVLPGEEKESFAELRAFLTGVIRPQIGEFGGNIFKEAAELVLADFDSASTNPPEPDDRQIFPKLNWVRRS